MGCRGRGLRTHDRLLVVGVLPRDLDVDRRLVDAPLPDQLVRVQLEPAPDSTSIQQVLRSIPVPGDLALRSRYDALIDFPRTLSSLARGGPIRSTDGERRPQVLFRIVSAIDEAFTPAAAFLRGSNPTLGDQAPLVVLADEPPVQAEPRLLAAVEALLTA